MSHGPLLLGLNLLCFEPQLASFRRGVTCAGEISSKLLLAQQRLGRSPHVDNRRGRFTELLFFRQLPEKECGTCIKPLSSAYARSDTLRARTLYLRTGLPKGKWSGWQALLLSLHH